MSKTLDVFAEDDDGTLSTPRVDIPVFDDDSDDVQLAIAHTPDDVPQHVQTGAPGSTVECETCARKVKVRKDGQLSSHKCEPKPQRGNRLETLPERRSPMRASTRNFAIGIIGWAIEEGSARPLANAFKCEPDDVPTDLPDADVMIGVPLDFIWPELPAAARSFIDKLADNADVIDCGIAWAEWTRQIARWTREQRAYQERLATVRQPQQQGSVTPLFTPFEAQEG